MATIIDSLLVRLGFRVEMGEAREFLHESENLAHVAEALGVALAAAAAGVEELVRGAAERMGQLKQFANQVGVSAREVQALGDVATLEGSSMEAMQGGLRMMGAYYGQAAAHIGRGAKLFEQAGIKIRNSNGDLLSFNEVLYSVADRMQKLGKAGAQGLGYRLGFDLATINILSKGADNLREEREKMLRENPLAESDYEAAVKTKDAYEHLEIAFTRLKNKLASGLFPTFQKLADKFREWLTNDRNIKKIEKAINLVVDVVALLYRNFNLVAGVIGTLALAKLGGGFMHLGKMIGEAAHGTGLLKAAMTGLRNLITGGLFGLILLLAEDLWVFHRGGDSLTGWMIQRFPYAVQVMEGAIAALSGALVGMAASSGPLGLLVAGIGGFVLAALALRDAWNPVMQWMGEAWDIVYDKIARVVNFITGPARAVGKFFGIDVFPELQTNAKAGGQTEDEKLYGGQAAFDARNAAFNNRTTKGLGALVPERQGNMLTWGTGMAAAHTTTIVDRSDNSTKVGSIHVTETKDAKATAAEVRKEIAREKRSTQINRQVTRDMQPAVK